MRSTCKLSAIVDHRYEQKFYNVELEQNYTNKKTRWISPYAS